MFVRGRRFRTRSHQTRLSRAVGRGLGVLLALGLSTASVMANPSGAQVRHGAVQIAPGVHMEIHQGSERAIIDWQSFSIGSRESVRIMQPSEVSVLLNRVVGQDPSIVLGHLQSNGTVFLINSNGILFGPDSTVNVGSLVASSLDIADQDFLAGRYRFEQPSETGAAVLNRGHIQVNDGGFAVLTGPLVGNEGLIVARAGRVELLSGRSATLDFDGRDLVLVEVGGDLEEGDVILPPGGMSEALSRALGVSPQSRADSLVALPDGRILLRSTRPRAVDLGLTEQGLLFQDSGDVVSPPGTQTGAALQQGQQLEVTVTVTGAGPATDPAVFAQDDAYFVEDILDELKRALRPLPEESGLDPTFEPWNDEGFLRQKFRGVD